MSETRIRTSIHLTLAAALLSLASATLVSAQAQVGSGHALDASLQVGSGGYNSAVYRGNALGNRSYYGGGYGSANQIGPRTNRAAQYSPYTGSAGQNIPGSVNYQGRSNYDTYVNEKSYSAGWQRQSGGYSSYSGPPGGSTGGNTGSVGAYKINGKIGG